jgi:hypothetical protein
MKKLFAQCNRAHCKPSATPIMLLVDNVWIHPDLKSSTLSQLLPSNIMEVLPNGSMLLVTTRDSAAVKNFKGCHLHQVQSLSKEDALRLFCLHAFGWSEVPDDKQEIDAVLQQLVEKCGGLPMALEVAAAHLGPKEVDEWRRWQEHMVAAFESEPAPGRPQEVAVLFEAFQLSFDDLSDKEKKAMLDVALLLRGELWMDVKACFGDSLERLEAKSLVRKAMATGPWVRKELWAVQVHDTVEEFCKSVDAGRRLLGKQTVKSVMVRRHIFCMLRRSVSTHLYNSKPTCAGVTPVLPASAMHTPRASNNIGALHTMQASSGAKCRVQDDRVPYSGGSATLQRVLLLENLLLTAGAPSPWPERFEDLLWLELLSLRSGSTALLQEQDPLSDLPCLRVLHVDLIPDNVEGLRLQVTPSALICTSTHCNYQVIVKPIESDVPG